MLRRLIYFTCGSTASMELPRFLFAWAPIRFPPGGLVNGLLPLPRTGETDTLKAFLCWSLLSSSLFTNCRKKEYSQGFWIRLSLIFFTSSRRFRSALSSGLCCPPSLAPHDFPLPGFFPLTSFSLSWSAAMSTELSRGVEGRMKGARHVAKKTCAYSLELTMHSPLTWPSRKLMESLFRPSCCS